MQIIRDYQFLDTEHKGSTVAIGNFDGVHLGHRHVIAIARDIAQTSQTPLGVLTFEPHPRAYFNPQTPPFRLMSAQAKASQLDFYGIDRLYQLNFNAPLSNLTAREFAGAVITDGLGLAHVVVGEDFCFGKGRSGDAADLQRLGAEFGFGVTIAPLLRDDASTQIFSSTAIRAALSEGKPDAAARMLGHWYRIENKVIHGDQRGRTLGYPTANLSIDGLHPPRFGVYACLVDVLDGAHRGRYRAVASIGERPTFGGRVANLEVFLFDFSADIYGARLSVALVDYQRAEQKFDSAEALIAQMDEDSTRARATLAGLATGSPTG